MEGCGEGDMAKRWTKRVLEGFRPVFSESVSGECCCAGCI